MPKNGTGEMRSYCSDQVVKEVPDLAAKMRKCMFDALEGRRHQEDAAHGPGAAVRALQRYVLCLECEAREYARHKQQFGCEGA